MADNNKIVEFSFNLSGTDKMSKVIEKVVKISTKRLLAFENVSLKIARTLTKTGSMMLKAAADMDIATYGIVKSTAWYRREMVKTSLAIARAVDEWQKLAYATKYATIQNLRFVTGVTALSARMQDIAGGSETITQTVNNLTISFQNTQVELRSLTLFIEQFDKKVNQLNVSLNKGREGLEKFKEETEKSGEALEKEGEEKTKTFSEKLKELGTTLKELASHLAGLTEKIAPFVDKIGEFLPGVATWIKNNEQLTSTIEKVITFSSGMLDKLGSLCIGMSEFITSLGKYKEAWGQFKGVLKSGGEIFTKFKDSMLVFRIQYGFLVIQQKLAAAAQWLLNTSLMGCPIVWIVAGIVGVIAAIYLLVKHWDKVSAFFQKLWEKVKQIFSSVWEWLKNMFLNYNPYTLIITHWDTISAWFVSLWEKVKQAFFAAWEWLKNMFFNYTPHGLIITHWDTISAWFVSLWEDVKQAFFATWEWIKDMFLNYTPHGLIITHWDTISAWFVSLWEDVKQIFSSAWKWIKDMFLNHTPYGLIIKDWDTISDRFISLWEEVKQAFFATWEWLKNMFLNYTPHGLIIKHWDTISDWFISLWEDVKQTFITTWNSIALLFASLNPVEWISGIWDTVGEYFSGLKERFFNWGQDIIQGLIDGITGFAKRAVDSVKNVASNIAGKFKSLLGINSPSRLFMEYGVNITDGLSQGIDKGEEKVSDTTGGLAMATTKGIQQSLQGQSENTSDISNTVGGFSLVYSPVVTIQGNVTEEVQNDFLQQLRKHKDEIAGLMERYYQNKQRLSFG